MEGRVVIVMYLSECDDRGVCRGDECLGDCGGEGVLFMVMMIV